LGLLHHGEEPHQGLGRREKKLCALFVEATPRQQILEILERFLVPNGNKLRMFSEIKSSHIKMVDFSL
jgi:hypothetical protein